MMGEIFLTENQLRDFVHLQKAANDLLNAFPQKYGEHMTEGEHELFKIARESIAKMYKAFTPRLSVHNKRSLNCMNRTMSLRLMGTKEVDKSFKRLESGRFTDRMLSEIQENCCKSCKHKDSSKCEIKQIFEEADYPKLWVHDDLSNYDNAVNTCLTNEFTAEEKMVAKHCAWCTGTNFEGGNK